jgi:urocanate hydratase
MSLPFKQQILLGIPDDLPPAKKYDPSINHAPRRRDILSMPEKKLALKNALRYFHPQHHVVLAQEFYEELKSYGRIYICTASAPIMK